MPFFMEDNGIGRFLARDTVARKDYYLGLQDTMVMLASDTALYKCMKFVVEEDGFVPDNSIVDSTKVYKVKYLNTPDSGSYIWSESITGYGLCAPARRTVCRIPTE